MEHRLQTDLRNALMTLPVQALKVFDSSGVEGTLLNFGDTVPTDGTSGYAANSLFIHHDSATDGDRIYQNVGSASSCDFDAFQIVVDVDAEDVDITDSAGHTANTNVETALAEIYQHLLSVQGFFSDVPLASCRYSTGSNLQDMTDTPATDDEYGSLLHIGSFPILEMTNGDTDSALRLRWAANDVAPIIFQLGLPANLDTAADMTIRIHAAIVGTVGPDTVVIDADTYFDVGDTKVSDASAAVTGETAADYTITIAAADIPASARTMTVELTPAAHANDALAVYRISVTGKLTLLAA